MCVCFSWLLGGILFVCLVDWLASLMVSWPALKTKQQKNKKKGNILRNFVAISYRCFCVAVTPVHDRPGQHLASEGEGVLGKNLWLKITHTIRRPQSLAEKKNSSQLLKADITQSTSHACTGVGKS